MSIPLSISSTGPTPTPPATLRSTLVTLALGMSPGITANLPASLIEDVTSTNTGALIMSDQDRVEAVNNVSPYTCNPYLLPQFGAMLGIPQGTPNNTSVSVVFSGPVGFIIQSGWIVSDGTYQYQIQVGGAITSTGQTNPLYAIALVSGIWTPLANTVTTIITSVPNGYTITVNNPLAGTPGTTAETPESFRSRINGGFQANVQGAPTIIKSMLQKIPGVTARLVSIPQNGTLWKIICGGGDPYAVAAAVYQSTINFSALAISTVADRNTVVTIIDPPNTYQVTFVTPVSAACGVSVVWNTYIPNFTAGVLVNQQAQTAILNAVNSVYVGDSLNLLNLTAVFQQAVTGLLTPNQISTLEFTVTINGVTTAPDAGTSIIVPPDNETYLLASLSSVTVAQG